ncbi:MAG: DUF5107 domain-containing protein [Parabacteroides sp.]|nr:DUF5107 domain-containing protein [Parabacteroides sp.]
MKRLFFFLCLAAASLSVQGQPAATVTETVRTMKTYPFSDPNPVADPSALYYPYFRFDGFSARGAGRPWKTVELENPYIKLSLFPEIGGKIWGAVDKIAGREFIYNNHVVKFRDIAMRGPWTSGGIEFNFGIIGHAPTSSTPVDYLTRTKADGSVSCYVSSFDYITRTFWSVEVNLPADKAYFTTRTSWYNASSLDAPYYQWMNAGYKASPELEFCYPGTRYIGHEGDSHPFPADEDGRLISWYKNNDSGHSQSYHVLGRYNDFYGAYWHDDDFGSVHHAGYDQKLGMKIFLWGLSREGGIWEDLLTDTDGQYVELQSGRMYNQPASGSTRTPYKHFSFAPQASDRFTEYWYPVRGTEGMAKAGRAGVLNVWRANGFLQLRFSPVEPVETEAAVYCGEKKVAVLPVRASVATTWKDSLSLNGLEGEIKVTIGDNLLTYSENKADNELDRPSELPSSFDWDSAYGLYTQGEQAMNQKQYGEAEKYLKAALAKEPCFVPALGRIASLYYREGKYAAATAACRTALAVNTYDGEANYLYGLCSRVVGKAAEAKAAFSVAAYTPAFRSAAYAQLAIQFAREKNWNEAERYAGKSLETNPANLHARHLLAVVYRNTNRPEKARETIASVLGDMPLFHPLRFEECLLGNQPDTAAFMSLVRNELPAETCIETAGWYETLGCAGEALLLYSLAPAHPVAHYRAAWLLHRAGKEPEASAEVALGNGLSPEQVFPFRAETLQALVWAATVSTDWKIRYYQALVCWANRDEAKALALLDGCGDVPYAPFYLCRAKLKTGESRLADLLRAEQLEPSWRTGMALLTYYGEQNAWKQAAETGRRYFRQYPDNYYIGLKQAKALCETGRYAECLSLLKNLRVLPNEGAYAGRAVYREACLYRALEAFGKKNYRQALASVEASEEWIENLGVGKPYADLIDNRLENYIKAQVYGRTGKKEVAASLLRSVADYAVSGTRFRSGDLLTAFALRETGRQSEADELAASWETAFPGNPVAAWCTAIYQGDATRAAALSGSRNTDADTTPWESSYRDADAGLLVRWFAGME